mgnify:CR=1 FL=1
MFALSRIGSFALAAGLALTLSSGGAYAQAAFTLSSSSFKDGERLPAKMAGNNKQNPNCVGENVSPALSWANPPAGTKSYALLMFDPRVRSTGIEVRLWSASYLLYLLAVFFPQSSVFRLLFPLSPLAGALAVPRSRAWRIGVLAVGVALQWWWIWNMYGIGRNFWQIP